MTGRNKESLSALMDGEADELEVRRILNQLDNNDELRENWKNYHLMGSLMRGESFDSIDLTTGINNRLDGLDDPLHDATEVAAADPQVALADKAQAQAPWYKPLTSVAVAASVTLAVLLGVQSIEPNDGLALATSSAQEQGSQQGQLTASSISLQEQQALENAQQQLQQYILQNPLETEAEKKSVLPFARVVEFQEQGK